MNKDKLLNIMKYFGVDTQQRKLMEEIHELEQAITLYEAQLSGEYEMPLTYLIGTKEHITEEIGDVLVLINQFIKYYDIEEAEIGRIMDRKVDRTIERIETGYYV